MAPASARIDEHVTTNRECPWRDVRARRVIATRGVHLEKRLLNQIFGVTSIDLTREELEKTGREQVVDAGKCTVVPVGITVHRYVEPADLLRIRFRHLSPRSRRSILAMLRERANAERVTPERRTDDNRRDERRDVPDEDMRRVRQWTP